MAVLGKGIALYYRLKGMGIRLYAANAGFFILLSLFPMAAVLLGLMHLTDLSPKDLLPGLLPQVLQESAGELITTLWEKSDLTVLGISALTALWSAGRGIHGLMLGLNAIYGVREARGYVKTRLICAGDTLLLLGMLLLYQYGIRKIPETEYGLRSLVALVLQVTVFTFLYQVLPCGRYRLVESLPGGILTGTGWLLFLRLFSLYGRISTGLSSLWGPVYVVFLGMLWLYFGLRIFFLGGAVNALRMKKNVEKM